jgi:integrase
MMLARRFESLPPRMPLCALIALTNCSTSSSLSVETDRLPRVVLAGHRLRSQTGHRGEARSAARQVLDRAGVKGWLVNNPARHVSKLRGDKAVIDPFSFDEVKTFLDKGLQDDEQRRYFTVAFFSGLRPSEQIVEHAIRTQRAASQLRGALIFPSRTGGPLDISNLRERVWRPALRRAGLRRRTMYQTRHTFASLALQSGEQIGWVARQLGHTTDEMVIRHHTKFIQNPTREDGSAIAQALTRAGL